MVVVWLSSKRSRGRTRKERHTSYHHYLVYVCSTNTGCIYVKYCSAPNGRTLVFCFSDFSGENSLSLVRF